MFLKIIYHVVCLIKLQYV